MSKINRLSVAVAIGSGALLVMCSSDDENGTEIGAGAGGVSKGGSAGSSSGGKGGKGGSTSMAGSPAEGGAGGSVDASGGSAGDGSGGAGDVAGAGAGGATSLGGAGGAGGADGGSAGADTTAGGAGGAGGALGDAGAGGSQGLTLLDVCPGVLGDYTLVTLTGGDDVHADANEGSDYVLGLDGNDTIDSQTGADCVDGGGGNDIFLSDAGNTHYFVVGGAGVDSYTWANNEISANYYVIGDFTVGEDKISVLPIVGGSPPVCESTQFTGTLTIGAAPVSELAQFVFDPTIDTLFWDPDGNTSATTVKLVEFATDVNFTATDFDCTK